MEIPSTIAPSDVDRQRAYQEAATALVLYHAGLGVCSISLDRHELRDAVSYVWNDTFDRHIGDRQLDAEVDAAGSERLVHAVIASRMMGTALPDLNDQRGIVQILADDVGTYEFDQLRRTLSEDLLVEVEQFVERNSEALNRLAETLLKRRHLSSREVWEFLNPGITDRLKSDSYEVACQCVVAWALGYVPWYASIYDDGSTGWECSWRPRVGGDCSERSQAIINAARRVAAVVSASVQAIEDIATGRMSGSQLPVDGSAVADDDELTREAATLLAERWPMVDSLAELLQERICLVRGDLESMFPDSDTSD